MRRAGLGCLCRDDGHLGHRPWALGLGPRGATGGHGGATVEIEGGVDGQRMGSGVAVVHVSRLYAKSSSHFDPPPRNETAEYPCSRASSGSRKQQVARESPPLHIAGWNTKRPFQQFKSPIRDGCNATADWHGIDSKSLLYVLCNVFLLSSNDVKLTLPAPSTLLHPPLHSCLGLGLFFFLVAI